MGENMDEKLSLKEVSALLKESPNVIRNWLKDFRPYIPIEKADNGYNAFGSEAIAVFQRIKQLARSQGFSKRQIAAELAGIDLGGAQTAIAAEVTRSTSAVVDPAAFMDLAAKVDRLLEGQKRMDRLLEGQQQMIALQAELLARLETMPPALPEPESESEKRPSWWEKIFKTK